jgi:hypothetical protein
MKNVDIGARLRAADPLIDDPAMSAGDVEAMRHAVVAAAGRATPSPVWWPPLLAVAATAAAMVIAVAGARVRDTHRSALRPAAVSPAVADSASTPSPGRRQLQFATPGGTRVIWVFDPEFNP